MEKDLAELIMRAKALTESPELRRSHKHLMALFDEAIIQLQEGDAVIAEVESQLTELEARLSHGSA